jgi:hypothetical protein
MTLLPCLIVTCVVAWFAAFVALALKLVVCPSSRLRSLVLSFLRTFVVRTWLALRSVDLHLL